MKDDNFGIDIKKYCRAHEAVVQEALAAADAAAGSGARSESLGELLALHKDMIARIQHERMIHLIVTVMTVFVEVFVVYLVLLHPELGVVPAVIMLVLGVLAGLYFLHYFFLENTVQHWYRLEEELRRRIDVRTE